MVATIFANLAMQRLDENKSGVMMALQDGNYTTVPANTFLQGEIRVDVGLYDAAAHPHSVLDTSDKPMFLY